MRILLAEPRYYTSDRTPYLPLGPAYVAAMLLRGGHEAIGLNANSMPGTAEEVAKAAVRLADGTGCGAIAMGGLCTTYRFQQTFFRTVKALSPETVLITGGNLFSSEPEFCMEQFGVDHGVLGEGELTMLELVNALESGSDPAQVQGVVSMSDGQVTRSPARPVIRDLDSLPFPAREIFLTPEEIASVGVSIYTSRSCPFHCTFCYHPPGSVYRKRSVPSVIEEINALHCAYGFTAFGFGDELFALDKTWTQQFCDAIERLSFITNWSCQMRATDADPALLRRMRQAGCRAVTMGFESGSDTILRSMKKKITSAISRKAIHDVRAAGICTAGGIILGDFEETPETVRQTVDFLKETALVPFGDIGFIVPYPGSPIYDRCLREGLIADKADFISSLSTFGKLRVNMTRMPDEDLLELQEWASREYYAYSLANRRGHIVQVLDETPFTSGLSIACQTCGGNFPLEISGFSFEIQRYCPHCQYPVYIDPFVVPHIERATAEFRAIMSGLRGTDRDVWVTPASIECMRLSHGLQIPEENLRGFLDSSAERQLYPHMGRPVRMRDSETLRTIAPAHVAVVSVRYQDAILRELEAMAIPDIVVVPLFAPHPRASGN
ncbi:2-hydroxyethylphosphonate methyltransferase [Fundidesulfovibrio magnetotacticus]|uniref:2-hydroxyethylphosphonate methyltransferase n=1 Tax=Fundidesulfovibrio magnetotacticus TaxID=2730080 RepID=A0A6V8LYE8_9BACT|nr:radical SAM protein [Fundidesulfovibrio magnetotacticus]GFK95258.1 2-hydroxyethylphosphonate methyltransferase [Fundidesulfovibrio magnetotacticus]